MTTQKTAELYFKKNDIYILDNYDNTIIINDNNQGLLLLDNSLHIQRKLVIPQKASIYSVYKKYDGSAIILYLPDAHQIIYTDLKTPTPYTITLPKDFNEEILSPNYYWNNNTLILTTLNDNFYQLDFTSNKLHPVSSDTVEKDYPSFFDFWNICRKYNILTFYPNKQSFIFQSSSIVSFFNFQQDKQHIVTGFSKGWHDVECSNNIFLFIHEKKIEIINEQDKIILKPHVDYIFLRAKFLNDNHFVILSSNLSNPQENLLEIYKFD